MSKVTSLFKPEDRRFGEAMLRMNASNPFLPERIAAERMALGVQFEERSADWNQLPPTAQPSANHRALTARCGEVADRARAAWPKDGRVTLEAAPCVASCVVTA